MEKSNRVFLGTLNVGGETKVNVGDSRRRGIKLVHLSEFPRKRRGTLFDIEDDRGRQRIDGARDLEFKRLLRIDHDSFVFFE